MAVVLQLTGWATVDLYGGVFQLARNGWSSRTATMVNNYTNLTWGVQAQFQHHEPVLEQMILEAKDTDTNIIGAYRDIYKVLESARRYHANKFEDRAQWLSAHTDNESARQSLIYEGSIQMNSGNGVNPLLTCGAARADLTILRHPFWESTIGGTLTDTNLVCTGDTYTFNDIPGDVPARISEIELKGSTGGPLTEFWVGIRPRYEGFNVFDPVWECEDGTAGTDAASTPDATASASDKILVDFSTTPTMAKRWQMSVSQSGSYAPLDYPQFNGSYRVLVRCQVSAGTIGIRLAWGYSGTPDAQRHYNEELYITNTSWMLVDLGHISIPPWGSKVYALSDNTEEFCLSIYAERVDGAGTLGLDLIILIPDQHMFHASGCSVEISGGNIKQISLLTVANDELIAIGFDDGPAYDVEVATNEWYLPAGSGTVLGDSIMVIAGQRDSSHELNDDVDFQISYIPRWATYRE